MPNDPAKARPAQDAAHPAAEPMHPGPGSHAEKTVRKAPDVSDHEKRKLGEEASRVEDA